MTADGYPLYWGHRTYQPRRCDNLRAQGENHDASTSACLPGMCCVGPGHRQCQRTSRERRKVPAAHVEKPAAKDSKTAATPFPTARRPRPLQANDPGDAEGQVPFLRQSLPLGGKGIKILGDCTYRAWLKKPNYFRVEATADVAAKTRGGVLIGDGKNSGSIGPRAARIFVRRELPRKTRLNSYMTKPAPLGGHSIGHETCFLGAGMSMPVIDPSTFHGYTDSLQAYVDGVKGLPAEKVGTEELRPRSKSAS